MRGSREVRDGKYQQSTRNNKQLNGQDKKKINFVVIDKLLTPNRITNFILREKSFPQHSFRPECERRLNRISNFKLQYFVALVGP